jgi:four helix bundle protein
VKQRLRSHRDLEVYQMSFQSAMELFKISQHFPKEETYSLTDQIRRSSRSVCANLAEAWRKRRYSAAFISKLSDSETEAAETQVWLEFAVRCGYIATENGRQMYKSYDSIIGMLVSMINNPGAWVIGKK